MEAKPMSPFLEHLEYQLHEALENDTLESLRPMLNDEFPADIADALERLALDDRLAVFRLLEPDVAAEVLNELGADSTRELLGEMHLEEIGDLLDEMPMDDAVEILTEDVPELRETLLAEMEPEDAAEVQRLLQYPPQSAGLLMTERYVRIHADITAAEAIEHVRRVDDEVETVTDLYALDEGGHLIGVVSLREVITAPPDSYIRDLMETDLVTVPPEMDQERAARLFSRYDFLALPVVDEQNRMLGIITVDDAMDVLTEENTEDILRLGAVESAGIDQPYFTIPLWRVIRMRFGWLLFLFLADTLTGNVLRIFEDELGAVVALSFYIPLLIGTGGNTGSQTVSTIIRGMAVQHIRPGDVWRVLRRELLGGLVLGLMLGVVAVGRSYIWDRSVLLSLVVGLSVVVICAWSNLIGSFIPIMARRLGIDPAVISAPLITTLVDATGLFIYLMIARAILGL
jgi:magnesium transporter